MRPTLADEGDGLTVTKADQRGFLLEVNGPTLDLLHSRLDHLPNLRSFFEKGAWGKLTGPLQPTPPTCYATLYCGANPGKTGLFDFFSFPAGGYEQRPTAAVHLAEQTVFHHLSQQGKRVGLLNAFLTDPPPRLNGFVVSGDEGVGDTFTYPHEIGDSLLRAGYQVPFGASYATGRELGFLTHVQNVLAMRRAAMANLFNNRDWDFGLLSIIALGELLHAFWRFIDPSHPQFRAAQELFDGADPVLQSLKIVDDMVGDALRLVGDEGFVMVMGAWGHRLTHSRVWLNRFLEQEGYLFFRKNLASRRRYIFNRLGLDAAVAERIVHRTNLYRVLHYKVKRGNRATMKGAMFLSHADIDWSRTRAAALGFMGQIYLNLRDERPEGMIVPGEYQSLCDSLRQRLLALRDPRNGQAVVAKVLQREEIYDGPFLENAPHLLVVFHDGYAGDDRFSSCQQVVSSSDKRLSSEHVNESFFLARGPGVANREVAMRLEEVAPTILSAFGLAVPASFEGSAAPIFNMKP
jgi:predicted AlkP superfamily phosphohydrolase/phosphomutase